MAIFGRSTNDDESTEAAEHRRALVRDLTFELVPISTLPDAIEALPEGARVSVTCSPAKGIAETQRVTEQLVDRGFTAVPHISARMVKDREHTKELAAWFRSTGVSTAFVVAGDAATPGEYHDAVGFLGDLLDTDHGLSTIGLPAYPDSHPFISDDLLQDALHAKQRLLAEAGVAGYCTTQMCFDPTTITGWIRAERQEGMDLPVHLGLPGVVDKAKLLTMGVRLGIGQSLTYFKKNKAAVAKMLTSVAYDPNDLLMPLTEDLQTLGVQGLHVFTFNQVQKTNTWRERSNL